MLKWTGVILLATAIVTVAGFLGPRLAGTSEIETEFGQISVELTPSAGGGLEGYVPVADWGIRFEGPPLPFRTRAELRTLNRDALLLAAEGDEGVVIRTRDQLQRGAAEAVLRAVVWSLAVALFLLLLAAVLLRSVKPRWAIPAVGLVLLLAAGITTGLVARSSLERSSFENPTFFASGGELKRILEVIDQADVESPYGNEFENIVRSLGAVLATGEGQGLSDNGMYLGSDLHANPLVIRPVSRIVGNEPILMTGDFGQRGSQTESNLIAPRVAALGRRVVAVSGNHDSFGLMRRLAASGVTVLDRRGRLLPDGDYQPPPVIEVGGVSVAGQADPLEYGGTNPLGDRAVTFEDLDDPEGASADWVRSTLRWFDSLRMKPAVLMIHQDGLATLFADALAEAGYDQPLTIATGHSHGQRLEKIGSTTVVNPGSIGAGGAFDAGEEEIGLAHLRFNDDGSLRSVELISVEPFSGAARATRIVIDTLCPGENRCAAVIPDQTVTE